MTLRSIMGACLSAITRPFQLSNSSLIPPPPPYSIHHSNEPYVHDGQGRVHRYTIPHIQPSIRIDILQLCIPDLVGLPNTINQFREALNLLDPINVGTVVLRAPPYTGVVTLVDAPRAGASVCIELI
jgi:hypothetical protein